VGGDLVCLPLSASVGGDPWEGSMAHPAEHEGASRECFRILGPLILIPEALPQSEKRTEEQGY